MHRTKCTIVMFVLRSCMGCSDGHIYICTSSGHFTLPCKYVNRVNLFRVHALHALKGYMCILVANFNTLHCKYVNLFCVHAWAALTGSVCILFANITLYCKFVNLFCVHAWAAQTDIYIYLIPAATPLCFVNTLIVLICLCSRMSCTDGLPNVYCWSTLQFIVNSLICSVFTHGLH